MQCYSHSSWCGRSLWSKIMHFKQQARRNCLYSFSSHPQHWSMMSSPRQIIHFCASLNFNYLILVHRVAQAVKFQESVILFWMLSSNRLLGCAIFSQLWIEDLAQFDWEGLCQDSHPTLLLQCYQWRWHGWLGSHWWRWKSGRCLGWFDRWRSRALQHQGSGRNGGGKLGPWVMPWFGTPSDLVRVAQF